MFYNYSHLFPKIKCLSEKNTVYNQFFVPPRQKLTCFDVKINKYANILYTKQEDSCFLCKTGVFYS